MDQSAWSADTVPTGLGDRERKRYTYASAPNYGIQRVIAPLPAAVAPYSGMRKLSFHNWDRLDQELNDPRGVWQIFMCPSSDALERGKLSVDPNDTTPIGQGTMMVVSVGGALSFWWSTNSDYAMNEAVFGYDYRPQYAARRLAGNLSRVRNPGETALFCDANPAAKLDPSLPPSFPCPWVTLSPTLEGNQPVTLADVLASSANVMPNRAQFDLPRHRGRANVAYADGHVESLNITPANLSRAYLTPR
jgi:prepilin-type processing-associated H-X9-DG protein